jgi:hypothetical protein
VKATEAKMFNYQKTYRLKVKFEVMSHSLSNMTHHRMVQSHPSVGLIIERYCVTGILPTHTAISELVIHP